MVRGFDRLVGIVPALIFFLLWELYARSGLISSLLLPAPSTIIVELSKLLLDPSFLHDAGQTLGRMLCGLAIATVIAVALGLACAVLPRLSAAVRPAVQVIAPLPKIAFYPALLLVLGFDDAPKIVLVAIDTIFPIFFATYQGGISVDEKLIWSARSAGMAPYRILTQIILPAASPSILAGLKVGIVIAAIVVFSAEMMASTDGLGHRLIVGARSYVTLDMFTAVVTIAVLSSGLGAALSLSTKRWLYRFG